VKNFFSGLFQRFLEGGRDDNRERRRNKKPILPEEEIVPATAVAAAPVIETVPQVSPEAFAQYSSLFAQPAPISTGVGSLLPSMEVLQSRG
jgi:hypothetical protein